MLHRLAAWDLEWALGCSRATARLSRYRFRCGSALSGCATAKWRWALSVSQCHSMQTAVPCRPTQCQRCFVHAVMVQARTWQGCARMPGTLCRQSPKAQPRNPYAASSRPARCPNPSMHAGGKVVIRNALSRGWNTPYLGFQSSESRTGEPKHNCLLGRFAGRGKARPSCASESDCVPLAIVWVTWSLIAIAARSDFRHCILRVNQLIARLS